jgi:hypothetical protein
MSFHAKLKDWQELKVWPCFECDCILFSLDFHAKMKDRLRTTAQGADTILWLAIVQVTLFLGGQTSA